LRRVNPIHEIVKFSHAKNSSHRDTQMRYLKIEILLDMFKTFLVAMRAMEVQLKVGDSEGYPSRLCYLGDLIHYTQREILLDLSSYVHIS
jgi:hypothetical protein